ncbi:BURP domain protein RD22-like [Mercurialis annua]|uniref:BURP domain protein RD22-like n=1 Tax=Mercurialis annua TaxID=3986 RepID=UPI0021602A87|nr:BURP domain protein RD22-like [Mercurialis annua]
MNMELHLLLPIFTLLFCLFRESNGSLSLEFYWKSMLPNTPLPIALQELLKPENISDFYKTRKHLDDFEENPQQRIDYKIAYPGIKTTFDSNVITNNTTTTIFFLHNNLLPENKFYLNFRKANNSSNFLPRKIAQNIPFSTEKYPEIFEYFSIESTSKEAQMIKHAIEQCEAPKMKGEEKYCATSLESLVDFVVSKYGKNVLALANDVEEEYKNQNYTISHGIRKMSDYQIVCHKQIYLYAVFYCHVTTGTQAYMVPMVGDDGSKAKAVVICHSDTSSWNPQHLAFQVLKVKPGGSSICHFLSSDTIVLIPN